MARQEVILDDLTGEVGARPVVISIDDRTWQIDLADTSLARLDKALTPFTSRATPVGVKNGGARSKNGGGARSKTSGTGLTDQDRANLRVWAAENEIAVPSRGRIPNAIIDQYRASKRRK